MLKADSDEFFSLALGLSVFRLPQLLPYYVEPKMGIGPPMLVDCVMVRDVGVFMSADAYDAARRCEKLQPLELREETPRPLGGTRDLR